MRIPLAGVLVIASLVSFRASAQVSSDTPESITARFMGAMRESDWRGMAALMHADALHEMRGLLASLLEAPNADGFRQQLLGVKTIAEAQALSDTVVFARLMQASIQQPGMAEAMRTVAIQILGQVKEGADTIHVVYRMSMTVSGIPITKMDVMTVARSPHGWRGVLKGDVRALASSLRAAIQPQD